MYYKKLIDMMDSFQTCPENCSGRGECHFGTCFCEIAYDGGACSETNLRYAVPFGAVFYIIAATSAIQLILRVREDFRVQGKSSIMKPTTQKLLYFFVIVATGSRGLYFSLKDHISDAWTDNLFVCYYPFLLSMLSLIICYWAEVFHLDLSGKPKFLTKSVIGFTTFNIFVYSLLLAQFVSTKVTSEHDKVHLQEIFSGCFAFMMLLSLLFFLVYGVEIFCKMEAASLSTNGRRINSSQLAQSRLGLIAQAAFQLAVILSMLGDIVGKVWKDRMSQRDRNLLEITFRVFELACAVWFPCVLWNTYRPEELWILNPKTVLRYRGSSEEKAKLLGERVACYQSTTSESSVPLEPECRICMDPSKANAGPLISPCSCNAMVHHNCIKKWLIKNENKEEVASALKCEVCHSDYQLIENNMILFKGFGIRTGLQTVGLIIWMIAGPVGGWIIWLKIDNNLARLFVVAGIVVLEWFLVKLLGMNMKSVKRKARFEAVEILDRSRHERRSSTCTSSCTSARTNVSLSVGESCLGEENRHLIETL